MHLYTYAWALIVANASNFEICIGINFECQQNTRYLQTCVVESKTMMDCYQKYTYKVNDRHLRTKPIW